MGPEQAHQLLERSFAQFQADRSVVGLVRGVTRGERMMDEIAAEFGGRDAPILDYARLRATIAERERAQSRASRVQRRQAANDALAALRRGDIITIGQGRRGGLAVVLEPAGDRDDPRPLVLTEDRWAGRISSTDFSGSSPRVGSMTLPKRVEHRQPRVRRDVASALRSAAAGLDVPAGRPKRGQQGQDRDARRRSRTRRRCAIRCEPIPRTTLADRDERVRRGRALSAHRAGQRRHPEEGRRRDQFAGPHLRPDRAAAHRAWLHRARRQDGDPKVTDDGLPAGAHLQRERSAGRRVSAQRHLERSRRRRAGRGGVGGAVRVEGRHAGRVTGRRGRDARHAPGAVADPPVVGGDPAPTSSGTGCPASREPDPGFVAAIHRWATTGDLSASLAASDASGNGSPLSAGDFVRWCRQVLDLLDQVRNAAPTPALRTTAKRAIDAIRRGVVAVDAG